MADRIHEFLNFWFGSVGSADLPTSNRTNLWFGGNEAAKQELLRQFSPDFSAAAADKLKEWENTPRGRLALIILYDQFPRYLYRQTAKAFSFDDLAQQLCMDGIQQKMDHSLTLIERVFFYMPLVHSENPHYQEKSIRLYQELVALSMSETTQVYQLFHTYANVHFGLIKKFGRFPQRNKVLGRESTEDEEAFLRNI